MTYSHRADSSYAPLPSLADALGSTRPTPDHTGAIYGFGWAGEQYDASSDLTYLRARYYSSGTASFLSRDTMQPNGGGRSGYNPYAYANNNPTTSTDPSGHFSFGDIADWVGGGIGAVFAYLAAVLECFSIGNCRYHSQHGDSATNDTVSAGPSAAEWVRMAIERGIRWINGHWPSDLACVLPCIPKIPNPIDIIVGGAKSLFDKIYGAGGLLDGWGYETVGVCLPSYQIFIIIVYAEATVCALKDTSGNEGVSLTTSGPAGISFNTKTYIKGGAWGSDLAVGLLISNANTIYELEGWSQSDAAALYDGWGTGINVSIGSNAGGERIFTYTGKADAGFAAGIAAGLSYTRVWSWDEVKGVFEDLLDEYI